MNETVRASTIALALLLPVLSMAATGTAQTPEVIRVATTPVDIGAQPFYAQELGLFKKAGLDATVSTISNGAAVSAAVMGGTFDIAQSNVPTLATAHERGLPFVIVAPAGLYSGKAPTSVCAVGKNSTIKTAKDLNGKTFGVTGLLNITQVAASAWLDKNGADLSSIKFVELPFSGMAPALVAGRIDAGVLVTPDLQEAVDSGQARVLANCYDAVASQFLVGAFFSTADYARAHPDTIKKFVAVMAETARWANSHQRESAQILEKWTKVHATPEMARVVYADRLSVAQIQPIIDASARYKALKAAFPATDLFAPGVGGR